MDRTKEIKESPSALAKVFLTALETVDAQVKREVLFSILENEKLFEEVEAMILWNERKDEPSVPFRQYLAQRENT
jgi:hypothetical protein